MQISLLSLHSTVLEDLISLEVEMHPRMRFHDSVPKFTDFPLYFCSGWDTPCGCREVLLSLIVDAD